MVAGLYACGAKERDGAKGTTAARYITCPAYLEKMRAQRATAKALSAMVPGFSS